MGSKFYEEGEQRAVKVNDLFATIAPRYDLINDLQSFWLHRSWKRRLIRLANPKPGESALDLCCGTGDIAFALAREGATVTGVDFSGPMLRVAAARSVKESPAGQIGKNPTFLRGDALNIPFPDNHFNIVTIGYGLRNLADFDAGLREILRVTKPGGRVLVLDFGVPENHLWRMCYFIYLRWAVPVFGKLFCGDSDTHAYILESLEHYPAQRGVEAKMKELNCANVRVLNLLGGTMSINYGEKTANTPG
jgi:demethylmenaquinone methyltransferase / 2-methoxy-6-polyprenyl-1,4-benzoquinol methylase